MGLENLTSIEGHLMIYENYSLTNLTGLNNVTFIEKYIQIGHYQITVGNPELISLTGLESLTSVGQSFKILNNVSLTDLSALNNLNIIGGFLGIFGNDALEDLSGLDNIDADTLMALKLEWNVSLSTCEVRSVCNYLVSPGGIIIIHDNAAGCNSQEEVGTACEAVGLSDINNNPDFLIYPNPANDRLIVSNNNGLKIERVIIYNQLGQIVFQRNEPIGKIDISTLGQGIYIIELTSNKLRNRQKLIVEK